jgi:hypothetical protein
MTNRTGMIAVLKMCCVPVLRDMGFEGQFPHFNRKVAEFVDRVTFQFAREGGSFCLNVGQADRRWWKTLLQPKIPPEKLRCYKPKGWVRLGAIQGDQWFFYDPEMAVLLRSVAQTPDELSTLCADLFRSEARPWWEAKRKQR